MRAFSILPSIWLLAAAVWGSPTTNEAFRPDAGSCRRLVDTCTAIPLASAIDRLSRCLTLAARQADGPLEADLLLRRADRHGLVGAWEASLADAERAAAAARRIPDPHREAWAINAAGDAHFWLWHHQEAAQRFADAADRFARLGDAEGAATALKNRGITQVVLGRRDLALIDLELALERYPAAGDDALRVSVLGNLGTIYARLGAPRSARAAFEEALALAHLRGHADEVADLEGRIGHLYLWTDRPDQAREHFVRALDAAATAGPTAALPLLEGAAHAFEATGDRNAAETALQELLAGHRATGHAIATCLAHVSLGELYEGRGDDGRASASFEAALGIGADGGDHCRWQALAGSGRVTARRNGRDAAVRLLGEATSVLDRERLRFLSDSDREALRAWGERPYRDLAQLLLRRALDEGAPEDAAAAFHVLERARAPEVAWATAESRGPAPTFTSEQARYLRELRREIASLRAALAATDPTEPGVAARERRLRRRELELDEHLTNTRRVAARDRLRRSLTAAEAAALLPHDAALVTYFVGDAAAFALVTTTSGTAAFALPTSAGRIAAQIAGLLDLMEDRSQAAGWRPVAAALRRDLVEPWISALGARIETLLVVADGELRSLPLEVLPDRSGRLLVEDFGVAYVPSATALSILAEPPVPDEPGTAAGRTPSGSVLLIADPRQTRQAATGPSGMRALYEEDGHDLGPVPFSRTEVRRVARLVAGSRVLAGPAATEAALKREATSRLQVLHFATHGLLSPLDPRRSALVLGSGASEDGFLQAREIDELRIGADLVVLSACRTARHQGPAGPGARTLAEAFFRAGALSVLGTLWEVEDRAAMRLTSSFYRHLARGRSKTEALRAAKLEAIARGATPYDWAAFVLQGEPFEGVLIARSTPRPTASTLLGLALVVLTTIASGLGLRRAKAAG